VHDPVIGQFVGTVVVIDVQFILHLLSSHVVSVVQGRGMFSGPQVRFPVAASNAHCASPCLVHDCLSNFLGLSVDALQSKLTLQPTRVLHRQHKPPNVPVISSCETDAGTDDGWPIKSAKPQARARLPSC